MKTKPPLQALILKKESCLGLQGAKESVCRRLRKLLNPGIPIKYREYENSEDGSTALVFSNNGYRATLYIEPIDKPVQEGAVS